MGPLWVQFIMVIHMVRKNQKRPYVKIYLTSSMISQLIVISENRGDTITGLVRAVVVDLIEKTPPHYKIKGNFEEGD